MALNLVPEIAHPLGNAHRQKLSGRPLDREGVRAGRQSAFLLNLGNSICFTLLLLLCQYSCLIKGRSALVSIQ